MRNCILKTAKNVCCFVPSTDGPYSNMNNDSSGKGWKYAIFLAAGAAVGSGITYLIMKNSKSFDEDYARTLAANSIRCFQSFKQDICKNGGRTIEEDKFTEPEAVMETANETAGEVNTCIAEDNDDKGMALKQDKRPKIVIGEQVRKPYFRSPVLFAELPDKKKVLHKLYKNLKDYMSCSSLEYFLYIFGDRLGNYQPSDNDFIDWTGGKYSLQSLIIKLYKPDGAKSVPRGTWAKVEDFFLIDGKRIPPKSMKLETNHIPEKVRNTIGQIVESSLNLSRQKSSTSKTLSSSATNNPAQS